MTKKHYVNEYIKAGKDKDKFIELMQRLHPEENDLTDLFIDAKNKFKKNYNKYTKYEPEYRKSKNFNDFKKIMHVRRPKLKDSTIKRYYSGVKRYLGESTGKRGRPKKTKSEQKKTQHMKQKHISPEQKQVSLEQKHISPEQKHICDCDKNSLKIEFCFNKSTSDRLANEISDIILTNFSETVLKQIKTVILSDIKQIRTDTLSEINQIKPDMLSAIEKTVNKKLNSVISVNNNNKDVEEEIHINLPFPDLPCEELRKTSELLWKDIKKYGMEKKMTIYQMRRYGFSAQELNWLVKNGLYVPRTKDENM